MTTRSEELVERINREMKNKTWDQGDLARESGVNSSSISRLVNGQRGVDPESLREIGRVLGILPMELAYYIGLADELPPRGEVLRNIFIAEFERSSPERRKEIIELLKVLNKLDARERGGGSASKG